MVKRFFTAIFRLTGLIIVLAASLWGAVQPFYQLPYGSEVNKWLLFAFSLVILWNIKEFFYDLGFWGREIKTSYQAEECCADKE